MSAQPQSYPSPGRPSIAAIFSEPLTAILRVRYGKQPVDDPQLFRDHMRRLLQTSIQEARTQGYTSPHTQMAVLAAVGFLDESVLNLRTPAAEAWARRPLQEELFGGHVAGETFFQNFNALLRDENSAQVADLLELHCQCLLLGYKGRYAFGNSGELTSLLRAAQEKIARTRNSSGVLLQPAASPAFIAAKTGDRWSRILMYAALALAAAIVICFVAYSVSLHGGSPVAALSSNHTLLQFTQRG